MHSPRHAAPQPGQEFTECTSDSPPKPSRARTQVSVALTALLAAAVLLPLLGHRPLTSWDEGIYAEVSREMLVGRNWLVPHWNFAPWFEKPPLTLWLTALFFQVFGVTAFTARLSSALSAIALVALVHAWLIRRAGALAAWLASLSLLANFGFQHAAGVGETDTMLALCCSVALAGLARIHADEQLESGWLLFFGGFAFAVMTKGAAAVVLPLTVVVLGIATRWAPRRWINRWSGLGAAVFIAITLPWHLAVYLRYRQTFLAEYLGYHVLARATHAIEGHQTHWWYYLWVLLVSTAPFVLLLPNAFAAALKRRDHQCWAVFALIVVVFYSLLQTRLPNYLVPAYPALAVITGSWLGPRLQSPSSCM
jgi:4-amino-4-deoxy-L-arabinose transferase-like glycosyltransferase